MSVNLPTIEQLEQVATAFGMKFSHGQLEVLQSLMAPALGSYARLDQLSEPKPAVKYPRTTGWRPLPEDNPLGAWYWRAEIAGAANGPLHGKTLAIKDNVCVAGIPMMNGTSVLEGYVPDIDATIVTRILDAGGTILGKAACESLCLSGGSHTSACGPVHNPYDPTRSTGGSSSGSAALVASGSVDMAIGGDQGGSIRIPSSWSGIYGIKPTYGLVPYTGAFPIELTLDHLGPMARTVADAALLLEVLAGPDGLDPRQRAGLKGEAYTHALSGDVRGLRIGIVPEGFAWAGLSQKDVDTAVEESAHKFERLNAEVKQVPIAWHRDALHIWNAIATEGATMLMVAGNSMGTNWKGYYNTSLLDIFARGRLSRADDLPATVKLNVMLGYYMQTAYHGRYYAKAQNLSRRLVDAYDEALRQCDLLVMPTTPMKATRIPAPDASLEELLTRAPEMIPNTCAFDVTGHPAMNVPCAMSEGLPVGMMLVGRHNEDATVLRAADAFARNVFSPPPPPKR